MIDLERLELLVRGKVEPDNIGEEAFIAAYRDALQGTLLFSHLIGMGDILDELNLNELHLMCVGYAMGQNDLETVELTLTDNKNIH